MKQPHKHAELIKAWADGAEIERKCDMTGQWDLIKNPAWCVAFEYRIKPQPKIVKAYMHYDGLEELIEEENFNTKDIPHMLFDNNYNMQEHLELTFTNNKLTKVEMKNATN
jgi:hypothetical protein